MFLVKNTSVRNVSLNLFKKAKCLAIICSLNDTVKQRWIIGIINKMLNSWNTEIGDVSIRSGTPLWFVLSDTRLLRYKQFSLQCSCCDTDYHNHVYLLSNVHKRESLSAYMRSWFTKSGCEYFVLQQNHIEAWMLYSGNTWQVAVTSLDPFETLVVDEELFWRISTQGLLAFSLLRITESLISRKAW